MRKAKMVQMVIAGIVAAIVLASCNVPWTGDLQTGSLSLSFTIVSSKHLGPGAKALTDIAMVYVEMTHPSYPPKHASGAPGTTIVIDSIRKGSWHIAVIGRNAAEEAIYSGEADVNIAPGPNGAVTVAMYATGSIDDVVLVEGTEPPHIVVQWDASYGEGYETLYDLRSGVTEFVFDGMEPGVDPFYDLNPARATFKVTNTGENDLHISDIVVDPNNLGSKDASFVVHSLDFDYPLILTAGQSASFIMDYVVYKHGFVESEVQILSDDPVRSCFTFTVVGQGNYPPTVSFPSGFSASFGGNPAFGFYTQVGEWNGYPLYRNGVEGLYLYRDSYSGCWAIDADYNTNGYSALYCKDGGDYSVPSDWGYSYHQSEDFDGTSWYAWTDTSYGNWYDNYDSAGDPPFVYPLNGIAGRPDVFGGYYLVDTPNLSWDIYSGEYGPTGHTLTAVFAVEDSDGDLPDATSSADSIRWYRGEFPGDGARVLVGTGEEYTPNPEDDLYMYIWYEVTPFTLTGKKQGVPVMSPAVKVSDDYNDYFGSGGGAY